jgi:hypothetical protein
MLFCNKQDFAAAWHVTLQGVQLYLAYVDIAQPVSAFSPLLSMRVLATQKGG